MDPIQISPISIGICFFLIFFISILLLIQYNINKDLTSSNKNLNDTNKNLNNTNRNLDSINKDLNTKIKSKTIVKNSIVIGRSQVGKSTLIKNYCTYFRNNCHIPIGDGSRMKTNQIREYSVVSINNDYKIIYNFFDTKGLFDRFENAEIAIENIIDIIKTIKNIENVILMFKYDIISEELIRNMHQLLNNIDKRLNYLVLFTFCNNITERQEGSIQIEYDNELFKNEYDNIHFIFLKKFKQKLEQNDENEILKI